MYSLTIHFGPNAMVWSFLFKEKEKAESAYGCATSDGYLTIYDDFGQSAHFKEGAIHGALLEDLDLVEEARIQRSLANARCEAKFHQRAATDATIRQGMSRTPVLQPMGGFGRS